MVSIAVRYLLISIFGMFIFLGVERALLPFMRFKFVFLGVGVALLVYSKKLPFDIAIVRIVAGILIFIVVKPFVFNFVHLWYLFVLVGLGGLIFLDDIVKRIN